MAFLSCLSFPMLLETNVDNCISRQISNPRRTYGDKELFMAAKDL